MPTTFRLIVATDVGANASDQGQLLPLLDEVSETDGADRLRVARSDAATRWKPPSSSVPSGHILNRPAPTIRRHNFYGAGSWTYVIEGSFQREQRLGHPPKVDKLSRDGKPDKYHHGNVDVLVPMLLPVRIHKEPHAGAVAVARRPHSRRRRLSTIPGGQQCPATRTAIPATTSCSSR